MISNIDQRVLFYDASESAFTDITRQVNDFNTGIVSLVFDTGDYLYFGSFLPFNHKFFKFGAPNSVAATPTVETYDGTEWDTVVDQLDYTELNGATFGRSGILQFTPNLFETNWNIVSRTTQEANLPEFANGPEIYQKYWARISYSANISYQLKYVGSKFCDDDDLYQEYPFFNNNSIRQAWDGTKVDWEDQQILAAEYIVFELKRRNIIVERSQILELSTLKEAAVHRTAHIIWNGLGARNYSEELGKSAKLYIDAMNQNKFETDTDGDGRKDRSEMIVTTQRATR